MNQSINIIPVVSCQQKKQFVCFPYTLYKNDPVWVPPLKLERSELINPKKNPYFENACVQLFLAKRQGKVVGRISAQINRLHNERYQEKTGHFGLFDCINDKQVALGLFQAAEDWIASQGMNKVVGPFSLSINEEAGILVDGFDTRPFPFMPHNYSYYQELIESCGYTKIKDLLAWRYDSSRPIPEMATQIADAVKAYPGLVVRQIDIKNMERDIEIVSDIFNSAWSKNWGFIPWTKSELKKMAKDLKLILDPQVALIAEVEGKPAAISIAFPNFHDIISDLKGNLFPFNWLKLVWRLKTNKIKSCRLALLGIKREFRHDVLAGLSVYLYTEMHRMAQKIGYKVNELGWTLEDNEKINMGISMMGGEPYKKMRVYQKELSQVIASATKQSHVVQTQ